MPIVSPVRYYTDLFYASLPFKERGILQASASIGQHEEGTNWGPFVKTCLAYTGLTTPNPWCAAFLTYCLVMAGSPANLIRYKVVSPASTRKWIDYAALNGRARRDPARGFFWVGYSSGKGGHCGFIPGMLEGGKIRSIEGNTNEAGSREGTHVMAKVRSVAGLRSYYKRFCFIDITGLEAWVPGAEKAVTFDPREDMHADPTDLPPDED